MMVRNQSHEREQFEVLTIDPLVPEDHLVCKLESVIDFSFIYSLVEHLYSGLSRPSINSVVLFKTCLYRCQREAWHAMNNPMRS